MSKLALILQLLQFITTRTWPLLQLLSQHTKARTLVHCYCIKYCPNWFNLIGSWSWSRSNGSASNSSFWLFLSGHCIKSWQPNQASSAQQPPESGHQDISPLPESVHFFTSWPAGTLDCSSDMISSHSWLTWMWPVLHLLALLPTSQITHIYPPPRTHSPQMELNLSMVDIFGNY